MFREDGTDMLKQYELFQQWKGQYEEETSTMAPDLECELHTLSIPILAEYCMKEFELYRRGEPSNGQFTLELFYRALKQRDARAWEVLQHCCGESMYRWVRGHPLREVAYRYDSEENYVAQGFARFWQATVGNQKIVFKTLGAALQYLYMSLNASVIDTLRMYSRAQIVSLPETDEVFEPLFSEEDDYESSELWDAILTLLPGKREQRIIYLLYHCGLKPREIVQFCSQEFSDVMEIYSVRRNFFDRLHRNKDYLRWKLGDGLDKDDNPPLLP